MIEDGTTRNDLLDSYGVFHQIWRRLTLWGVPFLVRPLRTSKRRVRLHCCVVGTVLAVAPGAGAVNGGRVSVS